VPSRWTHEARERLVLVSSEAVPSRLTWVVGLEPIKMGGFERTCVEVARGARQRGSQVDFVFECEPCTALAAALSEHSARWKVVPRVGSLGVRATIALSVHLWRIKPNAVHLHFCPFYVPFFVVARCLSIPIIATYHYSGTPAPSSGIRGAIKRLRRNLFGGSLARITAVSASARNKFVVDYCETTRPVAIVYNGIAQSSFAQTKRTQLANGSELDSPRIIFVGALIREKGAHVGISALAEARRVVPQMTLTIVGDGPERSNLERHAEELGVAGLVSFLGLRGDVSRLFAGHDIAIVPSIWQEAFGYVVLEAMAAECPVVASDVGGIPEIVRDGVDGVLVPPADVAALAGALVRLWKAPQERATLVARARAKVDDVFSLRHVVGQYWGTYRDALRRAQTP
jgi:glycosyltransferase involved in cell wall biosynthesis